MSYFKFVSEDRVDIFENGCIRFTPASDFNDPLEFKPHITEINKKYLAISHKIKNNNNIAAYLRANIRLIKKLDEGEIDKYSLARTENLPEYREKLDKILSHYGVLSLFRNDKETPLLSVAYQGDNTYENEPRQNILMWSHYANNHKGMVIEFNDDFFADECQKVIYSDTRPLITYEEIDKLDENKLNEITLTKKRIWINESEYRVVKKLDEADIKKGGNIHLFNFNKRNIKSITLGCKVAPEFRQKVIKLLQDDPELRNVQLLIAKIDPVHFKLTFRTECVHSGFTNDLLGNLAPPRIKIQLPPNSFELVTYHYLSMI